MHDENGRGTAAPASDTRAQALAWLEDQIFEKQTAQNKVKGMQERDPVLIRALAGAVAQTQLELDILHYLKRIVEKR